MTQELVKVSSKVIAIEIDKKMVEVLNANLNAKNLEVINEDFLKVDLKYFCLGHFALLYFHFRYAKAKQKSVLLLNFPFLSLYFKDSKFTRF